MIPFFRKIRKQMADDNKPMKYARYAVGEVALVVIGILIALQINNWNEERKQRLDDLEFVESLHSKMVTDTTNLSGSILFIKSINDELSQAINLFQNAEKLTEEDYQIISNSLNKIAVVESLIPDRDSYDPILTNASLNRLDQNLKMKLLNYLAQINFVDNIVRKNILSLKEIWQEYVFPKLDFQSLDKQDHTNFDFETLKNDVEIKNAMLVSRKMRAGYLNAAQAHNSLARELLLLMEDYMSENQKTAPK